MAAVGVETRAPRGGPTDLVTPLSSVMDPSRIPSFAQTFPRSPALDELVEAFARGDYATVRSRAPEVERSSDDPEVRQAARTLVERTHPDPLAVALLAIAAMLLFVLAGWAVLHGKAP
ncbi:MAG TPA: hypothetical protein VK762_29885 [Polyangiaceae bacterium]|nr:hypothetical protein [Polyangiaceae bacterium]